MKRSLIQTKSEKRPPDIGKVDFEQFIIV